MIQESLYERLFDADANVSCIYHLGLMYGSGLNNSDLFDFLEELTHKDRCQLFNLNDEQIEWMEECSDGEELCELLVSDLNLKGFIFQVMGRIYEDDQATNCYACEFGYAENPENLENAIEKTLDTLIPRLTKKTVANSTTD